MPNYIAIPRNAADFPGTSNRNFWETKTQKKRSSDSHTERPVLGIASSVQPRAGLDKFLLDFSFSVEMRSARRRKLRIAEQLSSDHLGLPLRARREVSIFRFHYRRIPWCAISEKKIVNWSRCVIQYSIRKTRKRTRFDRVTSSLSGSPTRWLFSKGHRGFSASFIASGANPCRSGTKRSVLLSRKRS